MNRWSSSFLFIVKSRQVGVLLAGQRGILVLSFRRRILDLALLSTRSSSEVSHHLRDSCPRLSFWHGRRWREWPVLCTVGRLCLHRSKLQDKNNKLAKEPVRNDTVVNNNDTDTLLLNTCQHDCSTLFLINKNYSKLAWSHEYTRYR